MTHPWTEDGYTRVARICERDTYNMAVHTQTRTDTHGDTHAAFPSTAQSRPREHPSIHQHNMCGWLAATWPMFPADGRRRHQNGRALWLGSVRLLM